MLLACCERLCLATCCNRLRFYTANSARQRKLQAAFGAYILDIEMYSMTIMIESIRNTVKIIL